MGSNTEYGIRQSLLGFNSKYFGGQLSQPEVLEYVAFPTRTLSVCPLTEANSLPFLQSHTLIVAWLSIPTDTTFYNN